MCVGWDHLPGFGLSGSIHQIPFYHVPIFHGAASKTSPIDNKVSNKMIEKIFGREDWCGLPHPSGGTL